MTSEELEALERLGRDAFSPELAGFALTAAECKCREEKADAKEPT